MAEIWESYREVVIPEAKPGTPPYTAVEMAFCGGMSAVFHWMEQHLGAPAGATQEDRDKIENLRTEVEDAAVSIMAGDDL
jgi:hypothetical protein